MKKSSIVYIAIILIILVVFLVFWMNQKPGSLETALKLSGSNRAELEKVLGHYSKNKADSLHLRAAEYLISNCYIHSSKSAWFEDYNKKKIDFFPPQYGTSDKAKSALDSMYINANYVSTIKFDCQELNSSYLIAHIDSMISIWQSSPWKSRISFNQFCRYILPYRVLSEPQSFWPALLAQKYKPIVNNATHIVTAATSINEVLANDIKYNVCWVKGGIGLQSVPELVDHQSGMCDDLAVYGVCAMRACGIPSTVDFTIWAKTNMGHSWGVIFDENGIPISFGPGEQNPGEHKKIFSEQAYRKLAKVFRRSFEINQSGLWNQVEDPQSIPPFFQLRNILDVTSEYTSVYDVSIPLTFSGLNNKLVFICIYNKGIWIPIHWAKVKNGKAIFTNMGDDVLYVIGKFNAGEINPIFTPFVFDKNQEIFYLDSPDTIKHTITFKYIAGIGSLKNNPKHKLYNWLGNNWHFVQEVNAENDSALTIKNLTEFTLYKFEDSSRPFTIAKNKVLWW